MYHLLVAHLFGIGSDRPLLGRPYIQLHFAVGTVHGDAVLCSSVAKQILIRRQEVVVMNHRRFQLFAHGQVLIREIFLAQHMIAS